MIDKIEAKLTVTELLAHWPQTITVFTNHRMACVGCPVAPFETLNEVAAIYGLDLDCFVNELEQVVLSQVTIDG